MGLTEKDKIKRVEKHLKKVFLIHYTCEDLNSSSESSPRIISLSVIGYNDETATTFSLPIEAEKNKIEFSAIAANFEKLERLMLNSFFKFVQDQPDAIYVHWNMSDVTYGFPAIYHRYNVLTKFVAEPINGSNMVDLSAVFKEAYGRDYIDYPRLNNLIIMNNYDSIDLFTGEEEAKLINNGEFVKASRSNIAKVKAIRHILHLFMNNKLKTKHVTPKKGFFSSFFGD